VRAAQRARGHQMRAARRQFDRREFRAGRQGIRREAMRQQQMRRFTDNQIRRNRFAGLDNRIRRNNDFARRAWRQGRRAAFVAWAGPVFLPYIYSDFFDYTFFPYAYQPRYWNYAYDDFLDGIYWGYGSPYAPRGTRAPLPRGGEVAKLSPQTHRDIEQSCQPARGLTAWPFEAIERAVAPDADQKALLDRMRDAAQQAADAFKASCRTDFALTPPGRLNAMINRLESTLEALRIVRPPLEAFYNSLSDEQKERFNRIGPRLGPSEAKAARGDRTSEQEALQACKQARPSIAGAPIERIEDAVNPTDAQRDALRSLSDASAKAVAQLQSACPEATPLTPAGRLETMQKRIEAMLAAARTVKPALDSFYASLSNEQKARFNALGREQARR